jgi:hypothetical protein
VYLRAGVNHRDDNTTSLCEGYHSALKGAIRAKGGESIRLDRLIHHLLTFVAQTFVDKDIRRHSRLGESSTRVLGFFGLLCALVRCPLIYSKCCPALTWHQLHESTLMVSLLIAHINHNVPIASICLALIHTLTIRGHLQEQLGMG